MNAAFEDCAVMNEFIGRYGDNWEAIFADYQRSRKRNTDALADLSLANFDELRESVKSPAFVARKQIDIILNKLFPNTWIPLYTLISHSAMPYADAIERVKKQDQIIKWMGIELVLSIFAEVVALLSLFKRLGGYFVHKIATNDETLHVTPPDRSPGFNANLVADQSEPLS
jgi:kynurenine 3-monooxygenase